MTEGVEVLKFNAARQEVWRYSGRILQRGAAWLLLEAPFDREDMPFHGLVFGKGDRFVEAYFTDHWYNIFEIHDRADDHLKGWYCNISYPAEFKDGQIHYVDLALDLLVFPDGRQLVLDEDEFDALSLDEATQARACLALQEVKDLLAAPETFRLEQALQV